MTLLLSFLFLGFDAFDIIIILLVFGGFAFLNGKLAKWKGYSFWIGATLGIGLYIGTLLLLIIPATKEKRSKGKVYISISTIAVILLLIVIYICNNRKSDEDKIAGTWSYSYTENNENFIISYNGKLEFNKFAGVTDDATISVSCIDEDGYRSNFKYQCIAQGKYEIKKSTIIYNYSLNGIKIKLLKSDNKELRLLIDEHYIPIWKHEMIARNKEKILELNNNSLKVEIEVDGEKKTYTYVRGNEKFIR
ncbi:MAG: hypothetical protein LBG80_12430 [Bacteroidales bacterium]|jgi:hypothetical protein|nr:hypothetical protein [Bacteroidales bacterium]